MKHFVLRSSLVLAFLCVSSNLHAQYADLTGGSLSFAFSDTINTALQAQGVTIAAFTPAPYGIQIPFLGVNSGALNMANGQGVISIQGEIDVVSGTSTIHIDQLSYENFGTGNAITGNMYLNGHYVVRAAILTIAQAPLLDGPMAAGALYLTGIEGRLTNNFTQVVNSIFGVSIPLKTAAGLLTVNTALLQVMAQ